MTPSRHKAALRLHRELTDIWATPPGWGRLQAVNHTVIGKRFMLTALVFFAIGGVLAMLIRTQLATTQSAFLDAAAYARIKVAQKRGDLAEVLEGLRFPRIELLRLTRVWTRRTKADPALAAAVDAAIQAEEKRR